MQKYDVPANYLKTIHPVQDKTLKYMYFMDIEHPLSDRKGRVLHHRHIASVMVGRWVTLDEVVHHIDHNRANNECANLEIKTRYQHSIEHAIEAGMQVRLTIPCEVCERPFKTHSETSKYCSRRCSNTGNAKANWPSDSELQSMVDNYPATKIAASLGVSSSAVKKHCKNRGIITPPRGYWTKQFWARG